MTFTGKDEKRAASAKTGDDVAVDEDDDDDGTGVAKVGGLLHD